MDMTGERRIPAPRERVWDALLDPDVLRRAIPGCKTLERTGDNAFKATAAVKVGPIATSFTGDIKLLDLTPPGSYRIQGSGQGGPAGFARGGATVTLAEEGGATLLSYTVNAEVGGKLAQLGARLIDSSAKQMADQFFDRFSAELAPPAQVAAVETPDQPAALPPTPTAPPDNAPATISLLAAIPREPLGFPLVAWIGGAAWLVISFMLLSAYL
jgi:carbon monoxide dehydrogenase subunit G